MERMTVRELSQLRYLKREIELERERLAKLKNRSGVSAPRLSGAPRSAANRDRVGEYACEIAYLEQLIKQNMKRAICELLRLQKFIYEIPDSETRQIFHYRYIKGKSWAAIAFILRHNDDSTARKRHNVYLTEGRVATMGSRTRRVREVKQAAQRRLGAERLQGEKERGAQDEPTENLGAAGVRGA